jgi:AGZA family xanthine/uracil permease-like MFS transporter
VAGGRSGVTAVVAGVLFLVALFVAPLVGAVPQAATAPALIVVGSLMMSHVGEIPWANATVAVPAFLTILTIPLTFSIATGLSIGFTAYALLKLLKSGVRREDWLIYVLAALFIARFAYLGRA